MGWETTDPRGVCDGYLKCSVKADHQGFWSVSDPSWRYKELVVILMILITQLTLSNNKFIFRIGCPVLAWYQGAYIPGCRCMVLSIGDYFQYSAKSRRIY